jgi:hypothetical protein
VTVSEAWARASAAGQPSGTACQIESDVDVLVSASVPSSVAARADPRGVPGEMSGDETSGEAISGRRVREAMS